MIPGTLSFSEHFHFSGLNQRHFTSAEEQNNRHFNPQERSVAHRNSCIYPAGNGEPFNEYTGMTAIGIYAELHGKFDPVEVKYGPASTKILKPTEWSREIGNRIREIAQDHNQRVERFMESIQPLAGLDPQDIYLRIPLIFPQGPIPRIYPSRIPRITLLPIDPEIHDAISTDWARMAEFLGYRRNRSVKGRGEKRDSEGREEPATKRSNIPPARGSVRKDSPGEDSSQKRTKN